MPLDAANAFMTPHLSALDLVFSFLITWVVGLAPALIARYVLVKRPLSSRSANWIAGISCGVFFFLFRIGNALADAQPQKPSTGLVWVVIFFVSRAVMTRGVVAPRDMPEAADEQTGEAPLEREGGSLINLKTSMSAEVIHSDGEGPSHLVQGIEIYDRRVDWILWLTPVLLVIWLFYDLAFAVPGVIAFLLITFLRPLRARVGSLMSAAAFAAGACLLFSPLLGNISEPPSGGSLTAPLRLFVIPAVGFSLIANVWSRRSAIGQLPESTLGIRVLKWGPSLIAVLLAIFFVAKEAAYPSLREREEPLYEFPADDAVPVGGSRVREDAAFEEFLAEVRKRDLERRVRDDQAQEPSAELDWGVNSVGPLRPSEGVQRAWLIGAWAPLNDQTSDPASYCATDLGYRFTDPGRYSAYAEDGRFEISGDGRGLSLIDRSGNSAMVGESKQGAILSDALLTVGRTGNILIIDGNAFGRCP